MYNRWAVAFVDSHLIDQEGRTRTLTDLLCGPCNADTVKQAIFALINTCSKIISAAETVDSDW
jgi:hypothetical protein